MADTPSDTVCIQALQAEINRLTDQQKLLEAIAITFGVDISKLNLETQFLNRT